MKLKNKKTGEIANWCIDKDILRTCDGTIICNSLAELNEEWEDYKPEEPKEYWYIDPMACGVYSTKIKNDEDLYEFNKQTGNYFKTKKEAELAVRKLKAFKELKDKGFKFRDWYIGEDGAGIEILANYPSRSKDNLNLLFGGEK